MRPNERGLRRGRRLFLLSGLVTGVVYAGLGATRDMRGATERVPLTVKRFEYSSREIRLKKGVPVVFKITSLDVPHGFNVPDFGVRADVIPGRVSHVRLVPDRAGTFTFRCDIFCGTGHEDLEGEIIVSE